MSDGTKIEWATATWNPMTGCTPVSEACEHCYAERMARRFNPGSFAPTFHPNRLDQPIHWRKPRRVFVCSMSDLFHEAFTDEQIVATIDVMRRCWNVSYEGREPHTFMVLTKRPERMRSFCLRLRFDCGTNGRGVYLADTPDAPGYPLMPHRGSTGLPNIWLGVTAETQQRADERIPILLETPAAVRFVSLEPMLGPVDLRWVHAQPRTHYPPSGRQTVTFDDPLDWVILGGETGPGARPMRPECALHVYRQCQTARVPFFFKKWGSKTPDLSGLGMERVTMQHTREFPAVSA